MKKHSSTLIAALSVALLLSTSIPIKVNAETLIVVAKNANYDVISTKEAFKLWMGKKKRLNGKKVVIVDQKEDTPAQVEFYQKVLNKSTQEMKAYWAKLVFMGNSFPPRKLSNDKKVKAWLKTHPNSIGYIDASALDDSVKVLLVIK